MEKYLGDGSQKILDALFKIITGLSLLVIGWVSNELNELKRNQVQVVERHSALNTRVEVIESNRFTPKDALALERALDQRISSIEGTLLVMQEILERIDSRIDQMQERK